MVLKLTECGVEGCPLCHVSNVVTESLHPSFQTWTSSRNLSLESPNQPPPQTSSTSPPPADIFGTNSSRTHIRLHITIPKWSGTFLPPSSYHYLPPSCYIKAETQSEEKLESQRKAREPTDLPSSVVRKMSTAARRRLMRDFKRMQTDPPAGVSASPIADNVMTWYYCPPTQTQTQTVIL